MHACIHTYIHIYIHTYIHRYIHTCDLSNLGCTNHMPSAGCMGNQRLRHRHCAWLKAREVQKRGRCCCGQPGIEKCNKFIRAQGVTVKSPCKGRFSFWGRNPKSKKLVGTGFPYLCGLLPGEPHIYIYMCVCQIYMSQWDVQSGDILSGFGYCSDLFRAIFQCLPFLVAAFFLSHFVPGTIPDLPCNPRHSNSRERPHPPSP